MLTESNYNSYGWDKKHKFHLYVIMQKLIFQFVQFKNENRDSQLTLLNDVKNFDKTLKI